MNIVHKKSICVIAKETMRSIKSRSEKGNLPCGQMIDTLPYSIPEIKTPQKDVRIINAALKYLWLMYQSGVFLLQSNCELKYLSILQL